MERDMGKKRKEEKKEWKRRGGRLITRGAIVLAVEWRNVSLLQCTWRKAANSKAMFFVRIIVNVIYSAVERWSLAFYANITHICLFICLSKEKCVYMGWVLRLLYSKWANLFLAALPIVRPYQISSRFIFFFILLYLLR